MTTTGKNRIMIYGPKNDGTYIVEFRTAAGEALAISILRSGVNGPIFPAAHALWAVCAGCRVSDPAAATVGAVRFCSP
jgi:hypothetical protein